MRQSMWLPGCLLLALGATFPAQARADAMGLLSEFNVITFQNLNTGSDIEGRAMIGGDLLGNATLGNNPSRPPAGASSYNTLTVYGSNRSSGSVNVDVGGATIGKDNQNTVTLNGTGNLAVGGNNTGQLTANSGSVSVGGTNTATISAGANAGAGQSAYIGGANSGSVTVGGSNAQLAINGNNTGSLTLNGGGTIRINGSSSGNIGLNGGSLTAVGSITGAVNLNNNATETLLKSGPLPLTAPSNTLPDFKTTFQDPLVQLSSSLAGLAQTAQAIQSGDAVNKIFTLTANQGVTGAAVLDISSALLFGGHDTLNLNLGSATSLIVNVDIPNCSGNCALTLDSTISFAGIDPSYVLWNFENADSLSIQTAVAGSILSPYATITNNGQVINGSVVADSYSGNGELHSYPFLGTVSTTTSDSTPVPEPSGLAVLLCGLGGLALLRRRRTNA